MNSELFYELKTNLLSAIESEILNDPKNRCSNESLLKILSEISFENRKDEKGRLSHFIVDSYRGNMAIGSKVIDFNKKF